uniref:Protein FAM76B n=1 Tax=Caenorhabditis japonica TaxID=281687 RepID=A0A8R1HLH6_CAEJA
MTATLLKCFNCRILLPKDGPNATQCVKCQKNEAKYGKPGTCQYCQLNAAFHDQKCVWCSHAERKFGNPFECAQCHLRCAFPRHEREKTDSTSFLCRLCILTARQSGLTVMAGVQVPPEKPDKPAEPSTEQRERDRHRHHSSTHRSSHHHNHNSHHSSSRDRHDRKRHHDEEKKTTSGNGNQNATSSALPAAPLLPTNENGQGALPPFENNSVDMVKQQKMEDEIGRLKRLIQEKDSLIFDKDKQISNLKADQYNMEKKHRERVQQLIKEKEESIRAIEHIKKKKTN